MLKPLFLVLVCAFNLTSHPLQARLPDPTAKNLKDSPARSQKSASLMQQCIDGIKKSRPGLAAQAADICGRVFGAQQKGTEDAVASSQEDCQGLLESYQIPRGTVQKLCAQRAEALQSAEQDEASVQGSDQDSGGSSF